MGADAFKAARDFLFAHSTDYATAHRDFRWPQLDNFNYALDWFDAELAHGPLAHQPALKITGDGAATRSFAELSAASNRVANGLRALGVKRGERILLMLGNVVPLWETMLAAMKLGAVVIPATTLLTPRDLKDRFDRGRVRHLIATAADAPKFDGLDPSVTRIATGDAPAGWHRYDELLNAPNTFVPDGVTKATDPLLLYFTSGTTSRPKLVEHSHQSYPVGHLTTMYWIGLRPGDMHLNISSPGWAKHAVQLLLRAMERRRRPCSSPTSHASTRAACSKRSPPTTSPRSARRPPCGACSCRRTWRRSAPRCAKSAPPANR